MAKGDDVRAFLGRVGAPKPAGAKIPPGVVSEIRSPDPEPVFQITESMLRATYLTGCVKGVEIARLQCVELIRTHMLTGDPLAIVMMLQAELRKREHEAKAQLAELGIEVDVDVEEPQRAD